MSAPSEQPRPVEITRLLAPGPPATAQEIVGGFGLHSAGTEPAPAGRPRVLLNMVSTLDGRASIGGRSGPIGGRADRELFHALRTVVDAVMVGAGTARAEHYRRLVRDESARALRRERDLQEEPLACIVSGRLALKAEDVPLLTDPGARVAILTSSQASLAMDAAPGLGGAGAGVNPAASNHPLIRAQNPSLIRTQNPPLIRAQNPPLIRAQIEYIRAAREGRLDLASAMAQLHGRLEIRTVLCEGGPHLNTQLLAAGLVDEIFLSLAPTLAGGDASGETLRILAGMDLDPPMELELLGVLEHESHLFLRYGVRLAR